MRAALVRRLLTLSRGTLEQLIIAVIAGDHQRFAQRGVDIAIR